MEKVAGQRGRLLPIGEGRNLNCGHNTMWRSSQGVIITPIFEQLRQSAQDELGAGWLATWPQELPFLLCTDFCRTTIHCISWLALVFGSAHYTYLLALSVPSSSGPPPPPVLILGYPDALKDIFLADLLHPIWEDENTRKSCRTQAHARGIINVRKSHHWVCMKPSLVSDNHELLVQKALVLD